MQLIREKAKDLDIDQSMLSRSVNEGFSGGEKKRNEIFQMTLLEPKLAILDETDSGLDIDALKIVAKGVNAMRSPDRATIVVTHYQRLLDYIIPDYVHVLSGGRIVKSGRQGAGAGARVEGLRLDRDRRRAGPGIAMTQLAEKLHPWVASAGQLEVRDGCGTSGSGRAATFSSLGFPTVRDEEWRFTNVAPITGGDFSWPAPRRDSRGARRRAAVRGERDASCRRRERPVLAGAVTRRRVAAWRRRGILGAAINGELQADREIVQRYVGQLADFNTRAFAALNTAFLEDGGYVHIPDGLVLEEPIQVLFVSSNETAASTVSRTLLIVLGDHPRLVSSRPTSPRPTPSYLTNAVTEVFVGEGAVLDHYKVQQEASRRSISDHARARDPRANFSSHSFSLGGRFVRNDVLATLDGEGAEVTLNGLYLADGDRLVDNHTTIDHARPHCPSHEVYKGILGGRAKAVFNGKIIVRRDAQKTDAKQTNRALLLSDDALINTKPQLEIFADDVKCTHGAAIGQLDEDALFYLRARGLTYYEARDMLIHAFAGDSRAREGGTAEGAGVPALHAAGAGSGGSGRSMSNTAVGVPVELRGVRAAFDVERIRADFPILRRQVRGRGADLPGQRRDHTEAAAGPRRADRLLHDLQRQRAPRRALPQRDRDRGPRRRARQGAGVPERRVDS